MQPADWCAHMVFLRCCHCLGYWFWRRPAARRPYSETCKQQTTASKLSLRLLITSPHDYIIGRGDLLADLKCFDVPELTREVRVNQTGTIGFPLIRSA